MRLNTMAVVVCPTTQAAQWANSTAKGEYRCTKCGLTHPKAPTYQAPKL